MPGRKKTGKKYYEMLMRSYLGYKIVNDLIHPSDSIFQVCLKMYYLKKYGKSSLIV